MHPDEETLAILAEIGDLDREYHEGFPPPEEDADLEAEAERAHAGEARRLAWLASHPGFSDNANEWEEADGYALARKATGPGGAP